MSRPHPPAQISSLPRRLLSLPSWTPGNDDTSSVRQPLEHSNEEQYQQPGNPSPNCSLTNRVVHFVRL